MPCRAAKSDPKQDLVPDLNGFHTDVVGVFNSADESATVEGNVKLTGQVVKCSVVNDNLGELVAKRSNIEQFVRVDTGRGIGCQISYIIRAGSTRMQPYRLDATQYF